MTNAVLLGRIAIKIISDPAYNQRIQLSALIMIRILVFLSLMLCSTVFAQSNNPSQSALLLEIEGAIGPATSDYIVRNMNKANQTGYSFIILQLDTPGGLATAMREINKAILASPIPVVSFVAPEGARAASAGTFIMYASHVAVMAPATNLGAATPVQVSGPVSMPGGERKSQDPATNDPKMNKALNDSIAYIRSLAQMRQRNEEWATQAVKEAASLSAKEALEQNVINFMATDITDLLNKLHGFEVDINGKIEIIESDNTSINEQKPDWRSQFLAVITNPNVAYILMLIGIYGLIFELANPGTFVSGVIGLISLLLALYAFQVLPVNTAGFALMGLGIALMIGEVFAPSFGVLGIGGIISFVTGSIILMDTDVPGFGLSPILVGATATVGSILFLIVIHLVLRARKKPVVFGREEMVGSLGEAIETFEQRGRIRFEGEIWNAESNETVHNGDKVRVKEINGLTLHVEPAKEDR